MAGSGCAAMIDLFFCRGGRDFNGFEYRVIPMLKLNEDGCLKSPPMTKHRKTQK